MKIQVGNTVANTSAPKSLGIYDDDNEVDSDDDYQDADDTLYGKPQQNDGGAQGESAAKLQHTRKK